MKKEEMEERILKLEKVTSLQHEVMVEIVSTLKSIKEKLNTRKVEEEG